MMKIFSTLIPILLGVATVARAEYNPPLAEQVAQVFTSRYFPRAVDQLQLYGRNPDVLSSGFSLLQPLAQLTLLSQGECHDELISKGLGLLEDADVHSVLKTYKELFGSNKDPVKWINKLYVSYKLKINQTHAAEFYGQDYEYINFTNPRQAAYKINRYVDIYTAHKIKEMINYQNLSPTSDLVLVNTVYFKNEWELKFPPVMTRTNKFFYDEGKSVDTDFMNQENSFKHGFSHDLDAELIQLNYKTKGFYFNIALPKKITGLSTFLETYKSHQGNLYAENNKFGQEFVKLYLPKFQIVSEIDLQKVLKSLGVHKIFEGDYGTLRHLLLRPETVKVDSATQKVFINVDEKGTESASADDFNVVPTQPNTRAQVEFKANHPFYFEVNYYGYTLFSGTVVFDQGIKKEKII